ncbi:hypothetical protein EW145_g1750 [Phellinidium pouzarii]|uniref:Glycopeptide n=1 Tax=Phellinidium pouzarii TaxID=167371 RepID=A0A4S4LDA3_9AGAM|nr:hypothetical protein EW145_g1750 [Phellinidium pouzarii]
MFSLLLSTVLLAVIGAHAETHEVTFTNNCGFGTPMLIQGPNVLSTGGTFVSNGPLISAIAYLQTGKTAFLPYISLETSANAYIFEGSCGFNGEGCTLVETTLVNPTTPGSGSSTDLSLIPPHSFSVTTGFGYFSGCDNTGADCTSAGCVTAFDTPDQTDRQVACQSDNVNLAITFCD